MDPVMFADFKEHRQIMFSQGARITEAFNSEEAAELIEPAAVLWCDSDPPTIDVVERLQVIKFLAGCEELAKRPGGPRPGNRAVMVQTEDQAFIFYVDDPRINPNWYA